MCKGGGMSQEQRDQIDSANNMENTNFTTPHGSQGVNNPNYADYVRGNPDLMANYNRHWIRGAPEPLSQNNEGISLAEFGAMHWNGSGRSEGRSMPGVNSGGNSAPPPTTNTPPPKAPIVEEAEKNPYFPMLVPEYTAPQALDYSNYMPSDSPFGGDGGLLYQPWSQDYMNAYPLADNILSYQPPELGLPQVTYSNPIELALIEYAMGGGEGGGNEEPEDDDDDDGLNDPEGGGGDGGGVNGGYGGNASGAGVGNSGGGGYGGTGPASKGGSGQGKAGQSDHY
jgi:hypothetical protein